MCSIYPNKNLGKCHVPDSICLFYLTKLDQSFIWIFLSRYSCNSSILNDCYNKSSQGFNVNINIMKKKKYIQIEYIHDTLVFRQKSIFEP